MKIALTVNGAPVTREVEAAPEPGRLPPRRAGAHRLARRLRARRVRGVHGARGRHADARLPDARGPGRRLPGGDDRGRSPRPARSPTLQQAFRAENALQCGFCTPGMLLTAHALLERDSPIPIRRPSGRPSAATTAAARAITRSSRPSCAARRGAGPAGHRDAGRRRLRRRRLHRPLGRAAPDGAARARAAAPTPTTSRMPGLLHAAFVRSPHAHARIAAIDTAEAAALPGRDRRRHRPRAGRALRALGGRAEELRRHEVGAAVPAGLDKAVWQGEPVVAVVAESRALAEDGCARVRVTLGAAAAGGGRRGGAGARRDAHPSRSSATTSCSRRA